MGATLRRAAYSTNIKTRGDFSCAFFDRDLRTIAQAFAQPSHLGSLAHIVPKAIATYGAERLAPATASSSTTRTWAACTSTTSP